MISAEAIDTVDRWLGSIACAFMPGALLLECIFSKGLFSSPPSSIYEFLIYIIYALTISLFYAFFAQAEIHKHLAPGFIASLKPDEMGTLIFPLVSVLSLTTVGTYWTIEAVAESDVLNIASDHAVALNFVLSFLITAALSIAFGKLYFSWYMKAFEKRSSKK